MTQLKLKTLLLVLTLSTVFLGASCERGINFDPDFYALNVLVPGDLSTGYIVNEDGIKISYQSQDVMQFGCMHSDKMKELAEILEKARMPKETKIKLFKALGTFPQQ